MANITVNSVDDLQNAINNSPDNPSTPYVIDLGSNFTDPYAGGHINIPQTKNILIESAPGSTITMNPNSANRPNLNVDGRLILQNVNVNNVNIVLNGTGGTYGDGGTPTGDGTSPTHLANDPVLTLATGAHLQGTSILVPQGVVIMDPGSTMDGVGSDNLIPSANNGVVLYGNLGNATLNMDGGQMSRFNTAIVVNGDSPSSNAVNGSRSVNIFGNCAGQSGYDYPLFNNNNRNQQGSGGSVIQAWSGTVNVSCAQFINNTASGQGYNGGAIFIGGDAHFGANQSYFQGNTAPTGNGGAIYLDSAEKSIINFSNFQSNSAQLGGAAYVATGKSDVIGSTFASNTATTTDSLGGSAGALYNQPAYAAGYPYPPNSTAYGNLIVAADNVFSGNNSPQTFTGAASLSGTPNIQVPTSISGGQQVLNNLDINYYNTLAPNLVTSKAASTPSTVPGGTFAYTLRVMNNGTAPTTNFLVSDPLPNGLTLMGGSVSGSLNGVGATVTTGGTAATPTFTFDSPLQPGDSATITFMVQVPADAPNGTVIANTANFTLDGTTNVPATSGNTIVGTPTLSASKVSSTDSVNPGDTFSYTITIANQGDAPTTNFFITDPLPNGLTMVPGSVDASINGVLSPVTATGTATAPVFTFPTQLNPGDSATVTFNVQVPQNAANTTFTNTAVATPDGITNIPATSGPVQMGTPLLNVVKGNTSTGNVAPGDSFLYTVSVTNDCTGNFPTTNPYFLNEFLPPGVTITGPVTDDKGDVITTNGTTGNVIFTVNGTVQPGETTLFKIPVTVDASARPGSLNNTVTAIPGNGGSPTHATDNTVNVASSPPALAVVKTHSAPDPLTPGDWFTYSLTIVNTGQSPTTNPYTVTDTLPGNLVYAGGATSSGGGIITNDATTGVITFHVSDAIPAGGTELLTIPVRVDPNAPVGPLAANSATVTPGNDGNPITATENNPPTVTATAPDLSALKTHSAPDPLYPGNSFIYTVTVANNGQTATTNPYTLTESLPPYLTYNGGATSTGGGTVLGNQNSGAITFNVGDSIPPGGTELIQIPVTVDPDAPAGPLQINSITVDPGNGGDPVTATCLPPTITALPPILDVDKTHTAPDPLHPGDSFTYALTIINSGQQPTTNPYTVTEQLPDGLTYAGGAISTGGGAISNDGDFGTITFTVNDSIPSGGVDLITIPVTLSPDASAGALDINSATVTPGNGGNPSTGTDNVPLIISPPVAVIAPPLMNVSKTANVASIKPGESFNYALTLTNSGGGPTDNPYTVTDSLPAYLSLTGIPTASSGASVTPDGTTGTITLTVNGSIPNQGTEVITLPVTVSDDAPLGMLANNTATVTPGNGGDPATGTDNTPPTMVPLPTPSLDVAKSHNLSSVQPGQTFNYLLTVTNNGTAPTANPYTVSDTLPDYLTYAGGATTSSGGAVTGTATGLSLDLNVEDSIPPGESRIISIPVTVSEDAPYSSGGSTVNLGQNTVTVDPGNGGNPSTAVEANPPTVMAPNAPIVYVLKNHTAQTVAPGDTFNYIVTIANAGNAPTSNPYTFIEGLPDGVAYAGGAASSDGAAVTGDGNSTGEITFTVAGDIQPGAATIITIPVTIDPNSSGILGQNTITIVPGNGGNTTTGSDPNPPLVTTLAPSLVPVMSVVKTHIANGALVPGSTLVYLLTISNTGAVATENPYTIQDFLPDYLTYAGGATSTGGGAVTDDGNTTGNIGFTVNDAIPPGNADIISIPVVVDANAPLGPLGQNQATMAPGNGGQTATGTDNQPPVVSKPPVPSLTVQKASNLSHVKPGQTFNYVVGVRNTGTAPTANPYTITESLPPGLTYAGGAVSSGGGTVSNFGTAGQMTLTVGDSIPVGGYEVLIIPVTLDASAPPGPLGQNAATIDPGNNGTPATGTDSPPPTVDPAPAPILDVSKTNDQSAVFPGQTIHYNIRACNRGNAPTTNPYVVVDALPNYMVYQGGATSSGSGTVTQDTSTGQTVFLVADSIPPGGCETITIPVLISPNAPAGQLGSNIATVQPGNGGGPATSTEPNPPTVTLPTPQLRVTKNDNVNESVEPGQIFDYVVTLNNFGNAPTANPYQLVENLPPHLTLQPGGTSSGGGLITASGLTGQVTFNIADSIPANSSEIIILPVKVDPDTPPGTLGTNTAVASPGNGGEPATGQDQAPPVVGETPPNLMAEKMSMANNLYPGDSFHYLITLNNTGQGPTSNPYTITEELPDFVQYAGGASTASGTPVSVSGTAGTVSIQVNGAIQAGGADVLILPVTVAADAPEGALGQNTATIDPGNGGNGTTVTDESPPGIQNRRPNMEVTKTSCSQDVTPGSTFNYVITLNNIGNGATANPYTVTESLPDYLSYNGGATTLSGATVVSSGTSQNLEFTIGGSIGAGQSDALVIPVTVDPYAPPGVLAQNTATIAPGNGGNPASGTDDTPPTVVPGTPQMSIHKFSCCSTAIPGATFTYGIVIKNHGTGPTANPYTITEALPDYITYLGGGTSSGGGEVTTNAINGTVTLTVGDSIPPNGAELITLPVQVAANAPAGALAPNTATVIPGNSGDPVSDTQTDPPIIIASNISVAKAADTAQTSPGGSFNYIVSIHNLGTSKTGNTLTITDALPDYLTLDGLPTASFGTVTNMGDNKNLNLSINSPLLGGQSGTVILPVRVSGNAPSGPLADNLVTVDPGNSSAQSALSPSPAIGSGSLAVTKTSNVATVQPGGVFDYSVTIHNTGNEPIGAPFTVTDSLPDGLKFIGHATSSAGMVTNNGDDRDLVLSIGGSIPPGGTATVTFSVQVDECAEVCQQLGANMATVGDFTAIDAYPPLVDWQHAVTATCCSCKQVPSQGIIPVAICKKSGTAITVKNSGRQKTCGCGERVFILEPNSCYQVTARATIGCDKFFTSATLGLELAGAPVPSSMTTLKRADAPGSGEVHFSTLIQTGCKAEALVLKNYSRHGILVKEICFKVIKL